MLRELTTRVDISGQRLQMFAVSVRENLVAYARARLALRKSDSFGRRARCFGPAYVANGGNLRIGHDFGFGGAPGIVQFATVVGGRLGIGDDVTVEYGTSITAHSLVSIGHRVRIGPRCVVSDRGLPMPHEAEAVRSCDARGIMIGDDVWLGASVTVMPGVRIGARAVIATGSVVATDIEDDALAAGNPATVLRVAHRPRVIVDMNLA